MGMWTVTFGIGIRGYLFALLLLLLLLVLGLECISSTLTSSMQRGLVSLELEETWSEYILSLGRLNQLEVDTVGVLLRQVDER